MGNTRRPLGAEQAEALGSVSASGESLRRQGSGPVDIVELAGGGVALPRGSTLAIERVVLPEGGAWRRLRLESDPHRTPPIRCELDGEETPLEQVSPGVWRPVRR